MKICCPTKDGRIDDHFGHCAYYTIFTVENGQSLPRRLWLPPRAAAVNLASLLF